jgi:hypothetical protein
MEIKKAGKDGERGRNRTSNLLIKSQLLCQLSYAPVREILGGTIFDCNISRSSGHRRDARARSFARGRRDHGCKAVERSSWQKDARREASSLAKSNAAAETAVGKLFLGTLANFCGQGAGTFAHRGAAWRQEIRTHLGTALDCADHRSVIHAIGIGHGNEPLLGTQAIDHALLARAEHSVRKNWKIPEHPKKINALKKRRH